MSIAIDNKIKGDIAVAATIFDLTKRGIPVLVPVVAEHLRYDLVADLSTAMVRIQVKYYTPATGTPLSDKTSYTDSKGNHKRKYQSGDFDIYAVYLSDLELVIYVPFEIGGKCIRTTLPRAGARSFYWYEDYFDVLSPARKRYITEFDHVPRGYAPQPKLRRTEWPSRETLSELLWKIPTTQIAERYNVTDNAVSKWARIYGLDKPPRGYWAKKRAGTEVV